MRRMGLPVLVAAALTAGAAAQSSDDSEFHPYFGAAYEQGWMSFKSGSLYGDQITGYAPFIGVELNKHFALEMSLRTANGASAGALVHLPDTTTSTATIKTDMVTSYHSSTRGVGFDILVRLPIGETGLTPFVLTGLSIGKLKEVSKINTTVTTQTTGVATPTVVQSTEYLSLVGKTEIWPEAGLGLAYGYGGAELRVLGRIQPLNMSNSANYQLTLSAGILMRL